MGMSFDKLKQDLNLDILPITLITLSNRLSIHLTIWMCKLEVDEQRFDQLYENYFYGALMFLRNRDKTMLKDDREAVDYIVRLFRGKVWPLCYGRLDARNDEVYKFYFL